MLPGYSRLWSQLIRSRVTVCGPCQVSEVIRLPEFGFVFGWCKTHRPTPWVSSRATADITGFSLGRIGLDYTAPCAEWVDQSGDVQLDAKPKGLKPLNILVVKCREKVWKVSKWSHWDTLQQTLHDGSVDSTDSFQLFHRLQSDGSNVAQRVELSSKLILMTTKYCTQLSWGIPRSYCVSASRSLPQLVPAISSRREGWQCGGFRHITYQLTRGVDWSMNTEIPFWREIMD